MRSKADHQIATSPRPRTLGQSKWRLSKADSSRPKPYLLFDAGGTLVFPDQDFLVQQAWAQGIMLTETQLFNGYYKLIHIRDRQAGTQSGRFPTPWARGYAYALFETLGVNGSAASAIAQAFEDRHQKKNMWTYTFDWVRETLSCLAVEGYRMSVISNSDGRTAQVFRDLGLTCYFERIFDSAVMGLEKPDPAIFRVALDELGVSPTNTLYIGDIYYVDVRGANRAGLGGLHLDPLGLYSGWPGIHLRDVRHLPDWLAEYPANTSTLDLFPTWNLPYAPPTDHFAAPVPTTPLPWENLWFEEDHHESVQIWPTPTSGALPHPQVVLTG